MANETRRFARVTQWLRGKWLRRVLIGLILFAVVVLIATPSILDWAIARELEKLRELGRSISCTPFHDRTANPSPGAAKPVGWDDVSAEMKRAFALARQEGFDGVPPLGTVNQTSFKLGDRWSGLEKSKRILNLFDRTFELRRQWQASGPPMYAGTEDEDSLRQTFREMSRLFGLKAYVEAGESRFDDAATTQSEFAGFVASLNAFTNDSSVLLTNCAISVAVLISSRDLAPHVSNTQLRSLQEKLRSLTFTCAFERSIVSDGEQMVRVFGKPNSSATWPLNWIEDNAMRANHIKRLRAQSGRLREIQKFGEMETFRRQPKLDSELAAPFTATPSVLEQAVDTYYWPKRHEETDLRTWIVVKLASLRLRCTDAAIAILVFEREHERMPASMQELIPNYYPEEPIDGIQPDWLSFQREGDEVAVVGRIRDSVTGKQLLARAEVRMALKPIQAK